MIKTLPLRRTITIFLFSITVAMIQSGCSDQQKQREHGRQVSETQTLRYDNEIHLANIRQLTFGGENAEAYFSFDETKLIYQSTRGDLQCDQIFVMTIDGNDKTMVSSGKGRTTCAFWFPDGQRILYSSTHASGVDCPPLPDRSKGYVWKLYPEYDIYTANADGSHVTVLSATPGYDAEATISPLGDKIVFTSTRDGDPEIYTMNLDGTGVKRLTFTKGYDGGPFFSWDGKSIVYRANHPEGAEEMATYEEIVKEHLVRPTRLEIFTMDADGKNQRQVTSNGKANFAPFFHPDGKRIIFSSNLADPKGRNFDLFIINVDGTGLERITYCESFDGFPMFSRDGKRIVFCSNRNNAKPGDTNVFIADWID